MIKVMVVDDSATVRKVLSLVLESDPDIEVIAAAQDPYEARDFLVKHRPDVITLDIEMPKMDGVTFLRKFMRILPTPTIIISSLTQAGKAVTIAALEAGAVDVLAKPTVAIADYLEENQDEIIRRVKACARANMSAVLSKISVDNGSCDQDYTHLDETTDKVIAIGASTGGVEHLARIIPHFPATTPGMVIVQHMPPGFTHSFAKRLQSLAQISVKEAEEGDRILPGQALLAPGGDRHLEVYRVGGQYRVRLFEGEKVSYSRPSVDVMFESVAKYVGKNSVSVLMTGMGRDGAKGMLACRQAGGRTIIQDENTCIIFGMPGEAKKIEANEQEVPLKNIPKAVLDAIVKM